MPRSHIGAFFALWLAASAAAQQDPSALATRVVDRDDPAAARALLKDLSAQSALKAKDPGLYGRAFARAAELADLADLVSGPSGDTPDALRDGLLARPACRFCQKPAEMESWTRRSFVPAPAALAKMPEAFWDWSTLSLDQRAWLAAHGFPGAEVAWAPLDLGARRARLLAWAEEEKKALMALDPKTPVEVEAMHKRALRAYHVLDRAEGETVWDRYEHARSAVDALARARKEFAKTKDPRLQAALREAQGASDPEARLAALSRLFEAGGRRDETVSMTAPAKPGQAFDDRSRRSVADLLGSGVMRETAGTWAGADLEAFYTKRPMKIRVAEGPANWLAWYHDDAMNFNQKFIVDYVKARGRTIDDLSKDPALLKTLVQQLTPLFVHEATHHRQDAWARTQGIPFWNGEAAEKEAMATQALFVLQKIRSDPSYRRFLRDSQKTSVPAREALALSQRLKKDGTEAFGRSMMATHYPEYLSMAGQAWCNILWHNNVSADVRRELARRRRLSLPAQATLAFAGDFRPYDTRAEFLGELPRVGTEHLEDFVARQERAIAQQPQIYARYAARLESFQRLTDQRLSVLAKGGGASKPVPPPGGKRL